MPVKYSEEVARAAKYHLHNHEDVGLILRAWWSLGVKCWAGSDGGILLFGVKS